MTAHMSDDRLERIDQCLSEEWLGAWADDVVLEIEDFLAKHAAFEAFLGDDD